MDFSNSHLLPWKGSVPEIKEFFLEKNPRIFGIPWAPYSSKFKREINKQIWSFEILLILTTIPNHGHILNYHHKGLPFDRSCIPHSDFHRFHRISHLVHLCFHMLVSCLFFGCPNWSNHWIDCSNNSQATPLYQPIIGFCTFDSGN